MMKNNTYGDWFGLMFCLGVKVDKLPVAAKIFQKICHAYTAEERAYHNLRHIYEGFRYLLREYLELGGYMMKSKDESVVIFAFWFHDYVYDPKRNDNEEKSAEFAVKCLKDLGLSHLANKVSELILLGTKHFEGDDPHCKYASQKEVDLIHDMDLAVLGRLEQDFDEYEKEIRTEYAHVPEDIFRKKRAEILQKFLGKSRIFRTKYFYGGYEERARKNLERSIARLMA